MFKLTRDGWKLLYALMLLALLALYFLMALPACSTEDRSWGLNLAIQAFRSPEVPSQNPCHTTTDTK